MARDAGKGDTRLGQTNSRFSCEPQLKKSSQIIVILIPKNSRKEHCGCPNEMYVTRTPQFHTSLTSASICILNPNSVLITVKIENEFPKHEIWNMATF